MPSHTREPRAISVPVFVKQRSVAFAGRLSSSHSSITPNASRIRLSSGPENQITWLEARPSWSSIRCRDANDWWLLCMSSRSSRYGRQSMIGMSMSPSKYSPSR